MSRIEIEFRCHDLLEKYCIAHGIFYQTDKSPQFVLGYGVTGKIKMWFDSEYHLAHMMMGYGALAETKDQLVIPWNMYGAEDNETDEYLVELNALSPDEFKEVVDKRNKLEYDKYLKTLDEY